MNYTFQYGQVIGFLPFFLGGAWLSLQIAFLAFAGGMVLGLAGAIARTSRSKLLNGIGTFYVVSFTNTPALVQVYFLYYGLGEFGVMMSPYQAVLLGMTICSGAYLTEIQRAGFASIHESQIEAAETMGFSRKQIIQYVIFPHVVRTLFPALSNHYIIMVLATSMAAVFGVEELTGRAFTVEAATFRSLEIFSIIAVIYVLITVLATLVLAGVGRRFLRIKLSFVS